MDLIKYQGSYATFDKVVFNAASNHFRDYICYSNAPSQSTVEDAFEAGAKWVIEQIRKGDLVIE